MDLPNDISNNPLCTEVCNLSSLHITSIRDNLFWISSFLPASNFSIEYFKFSKVSFNASSLSTIEQLFVVVDVGTAIGLWGAVVNLLASGGGGKFPTVRKASNEDVGGVEFSGNAIRLLSSLLVGGVEVGFWPCVNAQLGGSFQPGSCDGCNDFWVDTKSEFVVKTGMNFNRLWVKNLKLLDKKL